MSDLIVVAFDDEATAFDLRAALVRMQGDYLLEIEDIVVVTRSTDGKVVLHQAVNLTAAGAAGGGLWGALIGLLFLNPLLGAAVGAGAVCVLVRRMTGDKVLAGLAEFQAKGRVIQTSLSDEQEAALRAAIDTPAAKT